MSATPPIAVPSSSSRGPSPSPRPSIVQRACDQCHARKVKCDGVRPCGRCTRGCVSCTFNKPVLPKGPTPKRRRSGRDRDVERSIRSLAVPRRAVTFSPRVTLFSQNQSRSSHLAETDGSADRPTTDLSETSDTGSSSTDSGVLVLATAANSETQLGMADLPWGEAANTLNSGSPSEFSFGSLGTGPFGLGFGLGAAFGRSPSAGPPSPGLNLSFTPPSEASPLLSLCLESLVRPQLAVFYERIYPMMPVFPAHWIYTRLAGRRSLSDRTYAALVLGKVALSLVHPLTSEEMKFRGERVRQATALLDEVARLRATWDYGCRGSVEAVLTSYLMFGTLFEIGHADGARFRLFESILLAHTMRINDTNGLPPDEAGRRMRMFWILAVTERAYALQRSSVNLVFNGPIASRCSAETDGSSLPHLAKIFSVIDADVVTCWNGLCDRSNCRTFTQARAVSILCQLHGTAADVFGDEASLMALTESQKADLLITWQWLRNRIWRLAAAHGVTREDGPPELAIAHVLDVAATTVAICRRLSVEAMEAHGTGFVEKLVDIASIVTELDAEGHAQWADKIRQLQLHISRHRNGGPFEAALAQVLVLTEGRSELLLDWDGPLQQVRLEPV